MFIAGMHMCFGYIKVNTPPSSDERFIRMLANLVVYRIVLQLTISDRHFTVSCFHTRFSQGSFLVLFVCEITIMEGT